MPQHVIIDGNNLLHAMHAHAPIPHIGRETLVRIVERWAGQGDDDVSLVFDGAVPREGLAGQMTSSRITVRFSAPATADDVIVDMIHRAKDPGKLHVVTSDKAIRHEARHRRCRHTDAVRFVKELFPPADKPRSARAAPGEKPGEISADEAQIWLDTFGMDDTEPFDGHDAMTR